MKDDIVDPNELIAAELDEQMAEIRELYKSATTWKEKARLRRRMRRLRKHRFNRHIISW